MTHRITYRDGRFYKNDAPFFLIAADYPYFRDRRDNWEDRLRKQQACGVNTITFYTPWRHHLRYERGQRWYDFNGQTKDSRDLAHYLELIESLGLYMIIKPGPFIHSELNIGGLPDMVSPSFNPGMSPAERHHGKPAFWGYDASQLPAPFDDTFDDLVRQWLTEVRAVIAPYAHQGGPLIALQLNDETLYCTSNDPPWHVGYEPSGMRYYQRLVADRYGDIEAYNRLHGTALETFDFVPAPKLASEAKGDAKAQVPRRREDLLGYIDWAEYQWRLRRDLYVRYKDYLGIDLPYLTNYAGITPPIVENVPDAKEHASESIPDDYARLYAEWWFAMNRIECDAADYHYGMISWLGVAAYDRGVFDRYIDTARRAPGINMEENWGFGTLYDAKSRYPIIPFFQTLASVAGGATGYVIFTCVGTEYWDESLDRITKIQCNTFPSHAPIDEHGNLRPMYGTAGLLNRWFADHGDALLEAKVETDAGYLLYAPYAAVSSWIPDGRYWQLGEHQIPRCGCEGFGEFSTSLQQAGYSFAMFELDAARDEQFHACGALALHSAFFMDAKSQDRLASRIEAGQRVFISGELPTVDLEWQPCTRLKDAIETALKQSATHVVYRAENLFADGQFAAHLEKAGMQPKVRYADDMRAYVYRRAMRGSSDEFFVFFFSFDVAGSHDKWIEFYGRRVELQFGSKTSGVLRIAGDELVAWLVKGENEVEESKSTIRIRFGEYQVEATGDFSSSG